LQDTAAAVESQFHRLRPCTMLQHPCEANSTTWSVWHTGTKGRSENGKKNWQGVLADMQQNATWEQWPAQTNFQTHHWRLELCNGYHQLPIPLPICFFVNTKCRGCDFLCFILIEEIQGPEKVDWLSTLWKNCVIYQLLPQNCTRNWAYAKVGSKMTILFVKAPFGRVETIFLCELDKGARLDLKYGHVLSSKAQASGSHLIKSLLLRKLRNSILEATSVLLCLDAVCWLSLVPRPAFVFALNRSSRLLCFAVFCPFTSTGTGMVMVWCIHVSLKMGSCSTYIRYRSLLLPCFLPRRQRLSRTKTW